jgi:hypothetical protein
VLPADSGIKTPPMSPSSGQISDFIFEMTQSGNSSQVYQPYYTASATSTQTTSVMNAVCYPSPARSQGIPSQGGPACNQAASPLRNFAPARRKSASFNKANMLEPVQQPQPQTPHQSWQQYAQSPSTPQLSSIPRQTFTPSHLPPTTGQTFANYGPSAAYSPAMASNGNYGYTQRR